jgi:hypothetical protein
MFIFFPSFKKYAKIKDYRNRQSNTSLQFAKGSLIAFRAVAKG